MSTLPSESLVTSPFFLTVDLQSVRTIRKWQLSGCRGGYLENIRQFPKLNKLSISNYSGKLQQLKGIGILVTIVGI